MQSTVSYHILALEESVGARLVQRRRGAREASLTPAGEVLAQHARRALAELGGAQRALAEGGLGTVSVAVGSDVARIVLRHLHAVAAGAGFGLRTGETTDGDASRLLAGGPWTLAAVEPAEHARVAFVPLIRDRFCFVEQVPRRPRTVAVGPAELERASLVMHSGREARLRRSLDLRGIAIRSTLHADTDLAAVELVAAGFGCALVPELALQAMPENVHVRVLADEIGLPPRVVALAWSRERELTPPERLLVETLPRTVAAAAGRGLRRAV